MEDEIDIYETDLAESMATWGFRRRTMKSTRPSNEHCKKCGLFCMMATRMRVATLLLVCPSFFFVFVADLLAGDCVHRSGG